MAVEMMSAIAQLRPNSPGSPDPAILLAAVEAFLESLANRRIRPHSVCQSGVVRNV